MPIKRIISEIQILTPNMRHLVFALIFLPLSALAEIQIHDAWARATAPGMPMGAVYAQIENTGEEDLSLLSIKVDQARLAELHESIEIDGMMRMREITPFVVPAGQTVELRPAGKHIMLMGLTDALTEGEMVELRVTFSDGVEVPVSAIIGGFGQMTKPDGSR